MEREIQQLIEMGATRAQAKAALKQHRDVMEAAERIFDGEYADVVDEDEDIEMSSAKEREKPKVARMVTPDGDDDEDEELGDAGDDYDEDDVEDFADYDSDYEAKAETSRGPSNADPYAGIFFSKDRREEVIEVEEEPENVFVPDAGENANLMTQGQWMKGCPEGGEQSFLFSLYQELSEGECRCPNGCKKPFPRQKRDFFPIFSQFETYINHLHRIVPRLCDECHKRFCFACTEPISETNKAQDGDDDTLFHCPNLQGVILGVGLAMLEQTWLEETSGTSQKPSNGKRRKAEASHVPQSFDDDDDEDAYPPVTHSKKLKLGVGYAGDAKEDNSGHLEALKIQREKDEKLAKLLSDIRMYLPSIHREGGGKPSDFLVHPTALAHLRRRFNFVSSQLLRNDSLSDMSDRSVLYFELLNWLETISSHEALASMMAMPIMVGTSAKAMPSKRSGKQCIRERTIIYEGSSGPRELLEAIVIQAQAALKGLSPSKPAEEAEDAEMTEEQKRQTSDDKGKEKDDGKVIIEENQKLLAFCNSIISTAQAIDKSLRETKGEAFVERLHASLPKIPGTSASGQENEVVVKKGLSEEDMEKAYLEWANRVRFEYCDLTIDNPAPSKDDGSPHFKFVYNNEARMLANADIPKRSLAIAKELAVLTTNLPVAWNSSVFLRVDESRVDVIKALITGPEGTPYYNGCFLFDIFLGASYNQMPPSVKYVTTNGGKYRFNPNLYADGKVCLSLLGTWQGPGWVAGRSTLLQVLISIQSMILCEEPYLNEPAWSSSTGTPASKAYSANVRRMVVKTAMLGNLKNPPEPFTDVIRTHFRIKAQSIIKQLDDWLEQDDGKLTSGENSGHTRAPNGDDPNGNGLRADVDELKELLLRLENGEDIDIAQES
ncbi:ubiquitin conjugating enzyme family protein [Cristinia sonorae]|uniref:Ubiquitin conjugating enzyme family protein n=1 Tax=Cristinia sonorae TaxID=1940300 RepID=A0A8K0UK02_9AGAR|nr:ubiquitin conjugating enzyme family protein [Cristinia sonorae]